MKTIFKSFVVLFLMVIATELNAQTNTLNYTLASSSIYFLGENIALSSTLNISENTLVWSQQAGGNTDASNFDILSSTEDWNQETAIGTISYSLMIDGLQSEFILVGSSSQISATLTIISEIGAVEIYTFNIDSINY